MRAMKLGAKDTRAENNLNSAAEVLRCIIGVKVRDKITSEEAGKG
jgi:hypothetical protein